MGLQKVREQKRISGLFRRVSPDASCLIPSKGPLQPDHMLASKP